MFCDMTRHGRLKHLISINCWILAGAILALGAINVPRLLERLGGSSMDGTRLQASPHNPKPSFSTDFWLKYPPTEANSWHHFQFNVIAGVGYPYFDGVLADTQRMTDIKIDTSRHDPHQAAPVPAMR